jgi:hypothetical protein
VEESKLIKTQFKLSSVNYPLCLINTYYVLGLKLSIFTSTNKLQAQVEYPAGTQQLTNASNEQKLVQFPSSTVISNYRVVVTVVQF